MSDRSSPGSRTHSRARFRWAAALLPVLLLGLVEASLRLGGFEHDTSGPAYLFLSPEAQYANERSGAMIPDDRLFWRLRPGFTAAGGVQFVADTGFRSDFERAPDPERRRIVCLGDSNTFGLQVEERAAWPAVTEALLCAEGEDVECLNLGVPGYTSHQGRVLLESEVLDLRPDVVVCAFGSFNDWVPARGRTDAEQCGASVGSSLRIVQALTALLGRGAPCDAFADHAGRLDDIDTSAYDGPRRVGPETFEENLRELVRTARDSGAEAALVAIPLPAGTLHRNPIAGEYADITRSVAAEESVPLVDGWDLFEHAPLRDDELFADFCHPTARGHALLGAALAEHLAHGRE